MDNNGNMLLPITPGTTKFLTFDQVEGSASTAMSMGLQFDSSNILRAGMQIRSVDLGASSDTFIDFLTTEGGVATRTAMTIDEEQNVLIGTPTAQADNKLVIADGTAGGRTFMTLHNTNNNQFIKIGQNADVAEIGFDQGDKLQIGLFDTTTDTTLTPLITVLNSGNVGIGTSNPDVPLDVNILDSIFQLNNTGAGGIAWNIASSRTGWGSGAGKLVFVRATESSTDAAMVIDSSDNVGIGTVSPESELHVYGVKGSPDLSANTGAIFQMQATSNVELIMGAQDPSPYSAWIQVKHKDDTGASYPLALNPLGGNVGVGTSSPTNALSFGAANPIISHSTADGSDDKLLSIAGGGTVGSARGAYIELSGNERGSVEGRLALTAGNDAAYGHMTFSAGGTERMRIEYGGNVGIGTSGPSQELDVVGQIELIDMLYF